MLHYLANLSKEFHHEFSALGEPLGEETVTVDLHQVDVIVAGMEKNFIKNIFSYYPRPDITFH